MKQYLTEKDAAKLLCIAPKTLRNLRVLGGGPMFVRVTGSRRILYDPDDVQSWLSGRKFASTAEADQAAAHGAGA